MISNRISFALFSALATVAILLGAMSTLSADHTGDPSSVVVAGSLQSELGCSGDWQPDCSNTQLTFDSDDDVWQETFNVPAGAWEYKATLNDSWDENYGSGAQANGPNIPLNLGVSADVKFYYDHKTHWITDNVNSIIATVVGSFQDELGCPGDWQPDCLRSWLQDPDGDGVFTFSAFLPGGEYEAKVAINESWDENYGQDGVPGGANIVFTVPGTFTEMQFTFDYATKILTVELAPPALQPASVTIVGSLQSELGCPGDWQPDCAATHLGFDAEDTIWQGVFAVPAGDWEYKAALNDSWDENYGQNAQQNGSNIPLSFPDSTSVKFYYSHETHWVTDNVNAIIATVVGSFQSELGCSGDWQPSCLRSWLQDPDGDGIYAFSANLPAGDYEAKVAHNESWDENYGEGGVPGGPNIPFSVSAPVAEVFFSYDPVSHILTIGTGPGGPVGNLALAQAYWVNEDTLAWNLESLPGDATFALHYSVTGDLGLDENGVTSADGMLSLSLDPAGLPPSVTDKFPHLTGYEALTIDEADLHLVPGILKGQTAVSAAAGDATPIDATSIQIPGVLDDLFYYDGPLGADVYGGTTTLRLWAPTAQSASLLLFDNSDPASSPVAVPMTEDPATGVWSAEGGPDWAGKYYLYEVVVWAPTTGQIETNQVTDPYSLSLSADSARSQIVDLNDPALQPSGWDSLVKPPLMQPEDVVVYELHVRDFSWYDPVVPDIERGTFRAFTQSGSYGMEHLAGLADSGLTHIHLLPAFDFATLPEYRADQLEVDDLILASYPPDSDQQQAEVEAVSDLDGFNWGYDPWHYTVPEGGYSTDPDGPQRILEFREMVQSLNETGLRVVMDVVYNHTNSAGQNDKSVLDKLVPGYYHRLNADGDVETSTCCANTAAEHAMMEKLMVDSIVTWARAYKVDGFRFDLMGHHPKSSMEAIRAALDSLTEGSDGVDGSKIYLYGEAWNFGEVANDARFVQATQANMAGTGIGSFNDRIRDAVRGGGPFSGLQEQGFATGLFNDPNGTPQGSPAEQEERLKMQADWIRVSLAGALADYGFIDRHGNAVMSWQVDYNGQQAGYTDDPQEIINYAAAHDNETFFDIVQLKLPLVTTPDDRVRVQNVANDLIALGQGVPFFHAGQDMLRSKSMDRDSFNSGDWFNRLDFTYQWNNWGAGLPVASKNQDNWPIMQPLLADPALDVSPAEIGTAAEHFREMMQIRKSSRLFRLPNEPEVNSRLEFLNTGPGQVPGLIVMTLSDNDGSVDRVRERMVVLFNATVSEQAFEVPLLAGFDFELHEVQQASSDPVVSMSSWNAGSSTFLVPARTTAVFWAERSAEDQILLLVDDIEALVQAGVLNGGQGNALTVKLLNALDKIAAGQNHAAANQVSAFINQVEDFMAEGILTPDQGAVLIAAAEDILNALAP